MLFSSSSLTYSSRHIYFVSVCVCVSWLVMRLELVIIIRGQVTWLGRQNPYQKIHYADSKQEMLPGVPINSKVSKCQLSRSLAPLVQLSNSIPPMCWEPCLQTLEGNASEVTSNIYIKLLDCYCFQLLQSTASIKAHTRWHRVNINVFRLSEYTRTFT